MKTRIELAGFTRLELTVVCFVCGILLIPILTSALYRTTARSQRINCANNLKQLGLAFKTWALENEGRFPTSATRQPGFSPDPGENGDISLYFRVTSNFIADPRMLICPSDTRAPALNLRALSNSNLSYFIGIDAVDTNPQMFLMGDRNLTNGPLPLNRILLLNTNFPVEWTREMHHYQGNIGLADGSVQQFSSNRLSEAARNSPQRLAFP